MSENQYRRPQAAARPADEQTRRGPAVPQRAAGRPVHGQPVDSQRQASEQQKASPLAQSGMPQRPARPAGGAARPVRPQKAAEAVRRPVVPVLDDDDMDDDELTEEERRERRRERFMVLAGVSDFLGTAIGVVVILILVALLVTMWNWLQGDLQDSISLIERIL